MPELPEVERARRLIAETCMGYTISEIDAVDDKIVYCGEGEHVAFLKGQEPTWYRKKDYETSDVWPPKSHASVMKLSPPAGSEPQELAFIDVRRLGRLRLVPDPVLSHPPLSELGFDPVLDHPPLDEFRELISKKKGTIKGLIMDQAFSAGVGNWVADEVLYQARIHPMCPVNLLTDHDVSELHRLLREIPVKAIEVNADSEQFPEDWLFRWRWDKGKKPKAKKAKGESQDAEEEDVKPKGIEFLALPDGSKATISFVTVGGRTSAVVNELQKLPSSGGSAKANGSNATPKKPKAAAKKRPVDSDLSDLSDTEVDEPAKPAPRASRGERAARRGAPEAKDVKVKVETPAKPTSKRSRR
ncbi:Formamidopyrimidine-DNA glycosylase [Vanrija pseudolonga]|uniref:Formamidopyrimidine-DNA glycosylase n=1 Tax=Vanrija pseudolonga TaxID=143232 RepID=A0AAF0YB03_9TREE|nr:Formamidopyrimidine-DNA glycosylase [Vanrija pseudolonga]